MLASVEGWREIYDLTISCFFFLQFFCYEFTHTYGGGGQGGEFYPGSSKGASSAFIGGCRVGCHLFPEEKSPSFFI